MKKSILNLGETLNKNEQRQINGGMLTIFNDCSVNGCPSNKVCTEVFHDPDGSGPLGVESQWVCIDPMNYK